MVQRCLRQSIVSMCFFYINNTWPIAGNRPPCNILTINHIDLSLWTMDHGLWTATGIYGLSTKQLLVLAEIAGHFIQQVGVAGFEQDDPARFQGPDKNL
jgi:hypothetical protein